MVNQACYFIDLSLLSSDFLKFGASVVAIGALMGSLKKSIKESLQEQVTQLQDNPELAQNTSKTIDQRQECLRKLRILAD